MTSKTEPQYTHEFLISKGIQAVRQETPNEFNSEKEEQLLDKTMLSRILKFLEEKDQLKDKLLASKDEQNESMKIINGLYRKNVLLEKQLSMAKGTTKEQANHINQFEEEEEQYSSIDQFEEEEEEEEEEEMIDNKQLLREKEELKEAQERHAKAEEELRRRQLELNNRTKGVEQQKEELDKRREEVDQLKERLVKRVEEVKQAMEKSDHHIKRVEQMDEQFDKRTEEVKRRQLDLDNRTKEVKEQKKEFDKLIKEVRLKQLDLDNRTAEVKKAEKESDKRIKEVEQQEKELDIRKKELDRRELHLVEKQVTKDAEHITERVKLKLRVEEYSTKQEEYDALIDVLSRALSDYGKSANYAVEESYRNSSIFNHCKWTAMHQHLSENYTSIRKYLDVELMCNDVAKEKNLKDTVVLYK